MLDKTRRTFELIAELDSVLREHNIEYIVGGLAARAAIEKKNLEFPCADIYVQEECKDKAAEILASSESDNRSIIASEKGMYYVDETTTFIDRDNPATHGHYGINIHIIFIVAELFKSFGEIERVDHQGFTVNLPSKSKEYYNMLFVRDGKKVFPSYPNFRCIISTTVSYKQIAENMPELNDYFNSFLENKKETAEATERINVRDKIVKDVVAKAENIFIEDDSGFTFSVVMPVYNTEPYIREAIDSVINQTVGFEENIQLILVNDGSTDGSGEICLEYEEKYPKNITYIAQENAGASRARNAGLKAVKGKYVNFFDSDDIWEENTFQALADFISTTNVRDVDLFSFPITYFEMRTGEHPLNYKYTSSRIIDLTKEPVNVQLTIGNCFIKKEALYGVGFEEELSYGEDLIFTNEILLDKKKYGVVSEGRYYYRRREDLSSLASMAKINKDRFLKVPEKTFQRLFDMSINKCGKILPFIQCTAAYEIQFRFSEELPETMTAEEIKEYEASLKKLLMQIEDKYIFAQKRASITKKFYAFRMKYGSELYDKLAFNGKNVILNTTKVYDIAARSQCRIRELHTENGMLVIEGLVALGILKKDYKMILKRSKGDDVVATISRSPEDDLYAFNGDRILEAESFRFEVPIVPQDTLTFYGQIENQGPVKMLPMFEEELPLDHNLKNSFWNDKKCIVKYFGDALHVYKYSLKTYLASRHRFNKELTNN